ncbi:MAG: hypothetical protein IID44_24980 [Planctomycetes bacterium]|nr:hypothetical protein [Planctomycetota bacterium]
MLSTFGVLNTTDSGAGSLRQAILDTNANPGADIIDFNIADSDAGHVYFRDDGIAGSLSLVATTTLSDGAIADFDPDYPSTPHSWFSIQPLSALPAITDPVIIDGYTQPGSSPNTLANGNDAVLRIELNGTAASGANGLEITADGSTVQGLVINGFGGTGVAITGDNNVLAGNLIGTDVTGTLALGNGSVGVAINGQSNRIGTNGDGVSDEIERNVISANGTGMKVEGSFNVIAFNSGAGVRIAGASATANRIQRNSIHSNGDLGIDLDWDGVTANDLGDADVGPNNLQNFPIVAFATTDGGSTEIAGSLNSIPNATFQLDLYSSERPWRR